MKRRDFLRAAGASIVATSLGQSEPAHVVKPLPKQARWQDFELGLAYHFDLDVSEEVFSPCAEHASRNAF